MDFDNENNFDMDMNNEINENNEIDDNEEENNNYNEMGEEEENENEMDNLNQDFNNDINYDENVFNNQIEQENQNFDENDLYSLNMDNIRLKNKIQNLNNILQQKNGEINNLKIYYSKQIQLLNQNLNKYKNMEQNYINLQNEINLTKQKYLKEIKNKNNIIYNLQKGVDIKDIKLSNMTLEEAQNSDFIFTLSQQIKSIKQEILEEPDSDSLNQDYFQKLTNEQQIQFILNEINILSQKLSEYKNNNMKKIVHLRKLNESNDIKQKSVKDQYYLNIIDLKKNLTQNNINDIKFPDYSLNDKDETRKKYGADQVLLWRRSTDVKPPELSLDDSRYPGNDPKYKDLTENELPKTENLIDTIDRVMVYWNSDIKQDLLNGKRIIIAAHGNSLRGLIKYLDNMTDEEIIKLELQTGNPICYELDDELKPIRHYYLKEE